MGAELPEDELGSVSARRVTDLLAFDATNPSSIVSSLTAARVNGRSVSEAISSEMWEALNVTYNRLPTELDFGARTAPSAFFRFVRERAAIIAGLTESTMSRDDAWRFMVLGRSLERVDMLTASLSAAITGSHPDWVVLLRSCSAHEAFLRTYRREPEPTLAAEFLLLDRLFPRSVFYTLQEAEDCLASSTLGRAGRDAGRGSPDYRAPSDRFAVPADRRPGRRSVRVAAQYPKGMWDGQRGSCGEILPPDQPDRMERGCRRGRPLTYRVRIEHVSRYRYAAIVHSSYNETA